MNLDLSKLRPAARYPVGGPVIPLSDDQDWPQERDEPDLEPNMFEEYMFNPAPLNKKREWIKTGVAIGFLVAAFAILALALRWI